jgi:subfamily B ATP-binding cassette protein MsbA
VRHHPRLLAIAALCTVAVAATTALYPVIIQQASTASPRRRLRRLGCCRGHHPRHLLQGARAIRPGRRNPIRGDARHRDDPAPPLRRAHRADLATVARDAPARHAARFTADAAAIREALGKTINAIADVLTVIGLVASMVWLDWKMSLVAGVLYPIAVVPVLRLGKRIRRASGGVQDRVGEAAAALTESFGAARVVRTYRLEAAEEARAARTFANLRSSLMSIGRTRATLDPMLEALGGVAVAGVLAIVGWRVASGEGTVGEFTGFVAALLIAARPVRALGSLNAALQEGLAGLSRVYAVTDARPAITSPPRCPAAARGRRPHRLRGRALRLRGNRFRGVARRLLRRRARPHRRPRRPLRRGQVHRPRPRPPASTTPPRGA